MKKLLQVLGVILILAGCPTPYPPPAPNPGPPSAKNASYSSFSYQLSNSVSRGSSTDYTHWLSIDLSNLSTNVNTISAVTITIQFTFTNGGSTVGPSTETLSPMLTSSLPILPTADRTIYFEDDCSLSGSGWSFSYTVLSVNITWSDGTPQVL